jgi:hypothetical protein
LRSASLADDWNSVYKYLTDKKDHCDTVLSANSSPSGSEWRITCYTRLTLPVNVELPNTKAIIDFLPGNRVILKSSLKNYQLLTFNTNR